jgi:hypothetical protein
MWNSICAADRTRHDLIGADHYLRPTSRFPGAAPRREMLDVVTSWMQRRFG